jgi:hypothetical protein
VFDRLPISDRTRLLTYRWDKIKNAALLPILMKYAQDDRDPSDLDVDEFHQVPELTLAALTHWYELDPDGARPLIIKEITRPQPRYGGRALGFLPDETLPEVDEALCTNLISAKDFDKLDHVASLIARYATPSIMPRLLRSLDKHLEDWSCDIANPILAYILRVNPELARPRIEKAVQAARRKQNPRWMLAGCDSSVLSEIAAIHYNPLLEQIAIRNLDDHNATTAVHAAQMLGKYGSAAAEAELWKRYEVWSKRCAGHESELNRAWLAGSEKVDAYRMGVGGALLQALATGHAWLADPVKLQRLKEMNKLAFVQHGVDGYLEHWDHRPLYLSFYNFGEFRGSVAQYDYDEIKSYQRLKEKLAEFPVGTQFVISSPDDTSEEAKRMDDLCQFLNDRGIELLVETFVE